MCDYDVVVSEQGGFFYGIGIFISYAEKCSLGVKKRVRGVRQKENSISLHHPHPFTLLSILISNIK